MADGPWVEVLRRNGKQTSESFSFKRKRITISEWREGGVDIEEATGGSMFNLRLDNGERQSVHKILQGLLEAPILLRQFYRGDTGALHLHTVNNHMGNVLRLWKVGSRGQMRGDWKIRGIEQLKRNGMGRYKGHTRDLNNGGQSVQSQGFQ
ncbi:hypothetical protein Scep_001820 [Stephania cephalantha]|uniref:Uncharacterized protein n=1 Tax=Stephania cephalantha TaxID=152367 RepID=A0AAP0Q5E8_9MAGN